MYKKKELVKVLFFCSYYKNVFAKNKIYPLKTFDNASLALCEVVCRTLV